MSTAAAIDRARATPIEVEIERRGIRLNGRVERVGPCPVCGGVDRFGINTRKQCWHCRGCQRGGDVISLVEHLDGVSFVEAVATLAGESAERRQARQPPQNQRESDREYQDAIALFDDASPVIGTMGEAYLAKRRIDIGAIGFPGLDGVIRFNRSCPFGPGERAPCLVALYRNIETNLPVAIQRIAIAPNLDKLGRMALGPVGGAAMMLWPSEWIEQGLVIAEGLETALAAAMVAHRGTLLRPIWALGSAGAIRTLSVLAGVEALTIVVDHDAPDRNGRHAGQDAAAECAKRWTAAGREVVRLIPREQDSDFNTIVRGAT
jgi:hypothetical protein